MSDVNFIRPASRQALSASLFKSKEILTLPAAYLVVVPFVKLNKPPLSLSLNGILNRLAIEFFLSVSTPCEFRGVNSTLKEGIFLKNQPRYLRKLLSEEERRQRIVAVDGYAVDRFSFEAR